MSDNDKPSDGAGASPEHTPSAILITGGAGFIGSSVAVHFATKYPQYKVLNFQLCNLRKDRCH
jgi:hypothetical protein